MRLRNGRVLALDQGRTPLSLPVETIYVIAELASFGTRLALVRCNKWLYNICTPLLYEEIRLDTPEQLLLLHKNKNAMRNLKNTKTMFMDHFIFAFTEWQGIKRRLSPATYIVQILQAVVSLRRLHFIQSCDPYYEIGEATEKISLQFSNALSKLGLVSDPSFLPNLEILVDSPEDSGLPNLCDNRALALSTRLEGEGISAGFFPALDPSSEPFPRQSTAISPITRERIASSPYLNLSASETGHLVRDIIGSLRPSLSFLELGMLSADAVMHDTPSPIHDPLGLVLSVISIIDCPKLEILFFRFKPDPPHQSASAQYAALKKLVEMIPECTEAEFSYPRITWCKRYPEPRLLPRPAHLADMDWIAAPSPDCPESLKWWLDTLGLKASGSEEHLRQTATQLRRGARSWWTDMATPSEEEIYGGLLAVV